MIKKLNIITLGKIIYTKIKSVIKNSTLFLNNTEVINNTLILNNSRVENNKLIL